MNYNITTITNLCYIINDKNEVLLIMKKRGVGEGKWNAPGGKVRKGESLEQAAIREIFEETGIKVSNLVSKGFLEFIAGDKPEIESRCHIFIAREFSGELIESEEAQPKWFSISSLPYNQMWEDDIHWLPKVLRGEEVKMRFFFDKDEKMLGMERIVD